MLVSTDLVTLENTGGTETLLDFPLNGANPGPPRMLASGSAWSGITLLNAGIINGTHALWTRNNTTGALTQYLDINADTSNTLTGSTIASSGFSAATYPMLTIEGPAGDNTSTNGPALWTVDASGTLQLIPSTLASNGTATLTPYPTAMTAGGWATGLTAIN